MTTKTITALALAGAFGAALQLAAPAHAEEQAGAKEKYVPAGTCEQVSTPYGPGSLTEIRRPA
jgi:uncharacterized membrane protein